MAPGPGIRAALLLLATLAAALAPVPAAAQDPGSGFNLGGQHQIPTQQQVDVGSLNVTLWVMRDTRTISYTPADPQNPLGIIWNYNFTPGAMGTLYVKGQPPGNGTYQFGATLQGPAGQFFVENASFLKNISPPLVAYADHAFQFHVAGGAPPGPMQLELLLQSYVNSTEGFALEAERTVTVTLSIVDPVPPFATKKQVGDTLVFGWVGGGPALTRGGTGCLGGANTFRDATISQGDFAVACIVAITQSTEPQRLNVTLRTGPGFASPSPTWVSPFFNASSGGVNAPVNAFILSALGNSSIGPSSVFLDFQLERVGPNGTTLLGEGTLDLPFVVQRAVILPGPRGGINWVAQAPVLLATAGGLGYMVARQRRPRIQPRSQALRELGPTGTRAATAQVLTPEERAEHAEAQRQEVQEAAWDKKRQILEAKREDILKSVRLAEERKERGEITEHVLNGIKERKERQLEQVEREMEELR